MTYILLLSTYLNAILVTGLIGLIIYYLIHIGNRFVEDDRRFRVKKRYIFYLITILILVYLVYYIFFEKSAISGLLGPVLYSIAFAYLLNPLVSILEDKKIKRLWGVLIVYLLLIGIVVILSLLIYPKISTEVQNLVKLLPDYFKETNLFINDLYTKFSSNMESLPPEFESIREVIEENLTKLQNILISFLTNVTSSIIGLFSKVISLVLIPILTFYFLKDKEYFKKKISLSLPKKHRKDIFKVSREIDRVLERFIRGQMIVALFVGVLTTIGLLILGIDFALVIGLVAGIANFIPFFGPIIGIFPAVIFALLENPSKVIWVVLLFIIIQQIESNIISPKIVGESVGLHPIIIIIVLLIGGNVAGIIGMLLSVPIAAVIKIVSGFMIERLSSI